jgi:hypothetical protein
VRSRPLLTLAGLATLAAGLLRCGAFYGSEPSDAPRDAASEADASSARDADAADADADADAGPAKRVRTGVGCAGGRHCEAGDSCCNDGKNPPVCASDCAAIDKTFVIIECGRPSDCAEGFDCCNTSNGGCNGGYITGAQCVPAGTCALCGDGGQGRLACDRLGVGECPDGSLCSVTYEGAAYRSCGP